MSPSPRFMVLGACLALVGTSAFACRDAPLLEPARFSVVSPSDATLRWAPLSQAGSYRVQVRLSHPEGPTLRTIDTQTTETALRLQPLPEAETISVQALVSMGCDQRNMDDLLATVPLFTVRQRLACQMGALTPRWQGSRLSWTPLEQAQSYRVRVVTAPAPTTRTALDSGHLPPSLHDLVPPQELHNPSIDLSGQSIGPDIALQPMLLVHPVCQGKPGLPSAVRIPPTLPLASAR